MLDVTRPVISIFCHRRLSFGASLLIRMNEVTDLSIRKWRVFMGAIVLNFKFLMYPLNQNKISQ